MNEHAPTPIAETFPLARLNPLWVRNTAPSAFSGAIFDLDGTLLDSMPYWANLGDAYLESRGKTPLPGDAEAFRQLTLEEASALMKEKYGFAESAEEIYRGIIACIEEPYRSLIGLKPGAAALLEALDAAGVRMCVATASEKELVAPALKRLGMARFFAAVCTCPEAGAGKSAPDVFEWALAELGTRRETTLVFEDSLHAIETAKRAGFPVAAVADPTARADRPAIEKIADMYLEIPFVVAQ